MSVYWATSVGDANICLWVNHRGLVLDGPNSRIEGFSYLGAWPLTYHEQADRTGQMRRWISLPSARNGVYYEGKHRPLCGGRVAYARLMCWQHHGAPPGPRFRADHINDDPMDDRPENLQWLHEVDNLHKGLRRWNAIGRPRNKALQATGPQIDGKGQP